MENFHLLKNGDWISQMTLPMQQIRLGNRWTGDITAVVKIQTSFSHRDCINKDFQISEPETGARTHTWPEV